MFFYFQAEDGIRDLVRSRGLGDVYKRQDERGASRRLRRWAAAIDRSSVHVGGEAALLRLTPVSYTHLTLPTSDLV